MHSGLFHDHFVAAAEIWRAYAQGKLSVEKREAALRPLRALLAEIPLPVRE